MPRTPRDVQAAPETDADEDTGAAEISNNSRQAS